jgi:hypothetical protein
MLTIYLDQNKWIDLARAESGHPLGAPFVEALRVFTRAVEESAARFPLSAAHYFETGKQRDTSRRAAVAATMSRLAGTVRIAPPHVIVPGEIRRALAEMFGLPEVDTGMQLFGQGAAHAMGAPSLRYVAPTAFEGAELPGDLQAQLQRLVTPAYEEALLASTVPEGIADSHRIKFSDLKSLTDDRFVAGQEEVGRVLQEMGRGRLDDVMLATAIADIIDPLLAAAHELGVTFDDILDVGMGPLVERMPSRWVEMMLRRQRQANPQKLWHGNDLNDVTALAIAVPYCDFVVTEKSWSAMLNAAKVPDRFGTHVTSTLDDVVQRLRS